MWHFCQQDLQAFRLPVLPFASLPHLLHINIFCLLSHSHSRTHTYTQNSGVISESCCCLAVANPVLGLLFGRKTCIGQILFRQIKNPMSSCLHQSMHCLSDGPTRYTPALLYTCPCFSLSHIHLNLFACIIFSVALSPLLLILHIIFIFAAVSLQDYNLVLEARSCCHSGSSCWIRLRGAQQMLVGMSWLFSAAWHCKPFFPERLQRCTSGVAFKVHGDIGD